MHTQFTDQSVLEAANARLDRVFQDFDNVIVAFSGGKDSGVLLNLALAAGDRHGRQIGVFHFDYEAQYQATTDYVDATYASLRGRIDPLRCCVPVLCPTATSMHETHWRPWDPDKREIWVRPLPEDHLGPDAFDFLTDTMSDYAFQERIALWHHKRRNASRTAVLVGIRAEESLDRWRTIAGTQRRYRHAGLPWTTRLFDDVYTAYPIYDWRVEDIWTANACFGWGYNRLYDLFHLAGVPLHAMRVSSPFHNYAKSTLSLYRAVDPQTWGKLVSRVNGVNFTAIYGDTVAMGWKDITKPAHFTWRDYALFLLDTLPEDTAAGFREKLATSIRFWREKGGVLSAETQADLRRAGIPFEVGEKSNYKTDKLPVRMEYADDVDSNDFKLIPTWKRLCICILKNDHVGKYMGFSLTKREMERREAAIAKYRDL
ncbi:DUF3440 domain-containing protein [Pannonibacter tanglangensis]|uniref:DUF3440 domain-containing protein n=1 Tax=Pannonibacter tanglangensis TaxID=2750084 RepID=A0ABW9ZD30_9HYPH|nr:DUF3440 domain-containing protein [Pannonibacter sp. XCT-34]NBN62757.1 DUF3440 domain-containing protein [Pannonibacter sp. XCT-34]